MNNTPISVSEAHAPWNRTVCIRQCRDCGEEGDLHRREDHDGPYLLCNACVPKCSCGQPSHPDSEGALCARCEAEGYKADWHALLMSRPNPLTQDALAKELKAAMAVRVWEGRAAA